MRCRLVLIAVVLALATGPAGAERRIVRKRTNRVDHPTRNVLKPKVRWKREPKPGAHTHWPLPAAGHSHSGGPELIFTFDDGPSEKYTPRILDELKKRHLHAIFFLVGWRLARNGPHQAERLALVRRMIREGHIVGNHTMTHAHLCHLPARQAAAEIDEAHDELQTLVHMPVYFFRTPYGDHCRKLLRLLKERGLDHMHWDIDPQEWKDHDPVRVASTLRRNISTVARHNRRAVMIMHDTHKVTAKTFPAVMKWLDRENARRVAQGKPPVRIVDGSELARELMDPAFTAWLNQTGASAANGFVGALASVVP